MKSKFKSVLIVFTFVMAIGCGRQINCPNFNKNLLDWLPYQPNEVISFVNAKNDSVISLDIKEAIVKHTTHYRTDKDCGTCDDFININESDDKNSTVSISISLNENKIISERYSIKGSVFNHDFSNYSEKSAYDFNGVVYENVKLFENVGRGDFFVKLIIAKGFGIIGFFDKNGHQWRLKESALKSNDVESIKIQNVSCG